MRRLVAALACTPLVALSSGRAQQPADSAGPPGSELTVYLMTMGQGDQIWERFGHNAIGIRDSRTGRDLVFNWGLFSFEQPGFIGRFLRGEMMYWMGGFEFAPTVAEYKALNRTVEVQVLNLSPAQRLALFDFIRWNAQEENKFYRYDYFLDNCSTRVRDALDRVLGGALRDATDSIVTTSTYRDHALRLIAGDPLATVGVDIGLGRPTDRPITQWEEMFIPMKVRDRVRELRVPDDTGAMVPLVLSERVLVQADRAPERESPPALLVPLLLIGALVAGGLWWLGRRGLARGVGAARGATALAAVWCLAMGVFGVALLYLRTMTQHVAAYDNTNIFVYNPAWLLVLAAMPMVSSGATGRRIAFTIATLAGALTMIGVVLLFVPGFNQDSLPVALLAAPTNLVIAWLLRARSRVGAHGAIA